MNHETDLATVGKIDTLKRKIAETERKLADLKQQLRALCPPFEIGDEVRVKSGTARDKLATVRGLAQAFGDWVVLVTFSYGDKHYTYPADELEALS